ncbi:MAG TPA: hypothetical protein DFI00_02215 [Rhodospirillaceae bacterium]|nr:hypothetical protein [Alphaproteobacteria bacterium]OUT39592.1 MAG: hypothetical protein CBB62_14600 [Micavibrio sp. TMED2]HCI46087.1 hypothetical protein [Rhodospirillaceae bacterium]MAS48983.1 hypothetical protein [Alphaproteobacteria bacterium]MAX97415.1 hypothetical protein [Alphaproteobacteria bacterium]|tara:strand:+ start:1335 stop:1877 length:543 start_codon:yes stop_codon:yes gene_type:complete
MNTPLGRGLIIFGFVAFAALMANFLVPSIPTPEYDLSQVDRKPLEVRAWLRRIIVQDLTLKSADFDQKLQAAERYFTPEGYRGFIALLQQTRSIDYLRQSNVTVAIDPEEIPEVTTEGPVGGTYIWILEGDSNLTISFETNELSYPVRLQYIIARTEDENAFLGLKVQSMTIVNRNTQTN